MSRRHNVRISALKSLYQFDAGAWAQPEIVRNTLADAPGSDATHQEGFDLAAASWEHRDEADTTMARYSHDWPTYRQPVIDRSILRLAHYELTRSDTPPKVVINEAVELAKEFSTEKSHLFINGVLDKFWRDLRAQTESPIEKPIDDEDEPETTDASAATVEDGEPLPGAS